MNRVIRTLDRAEVGTLVGWAAAEGWNPGVGDATAFHTADPDGFLGAFVDGEMVAGISGVAYGEGFGFIGLYICKPGHRGHGYGRAVWDAAMARLGSRVVGLDGVPEQQANYRRMGFLPAYKTVRMTGRPQDLGAAAIAVVEATQIAAIDAACFPAPRIAFLAEWIKSPRRVLALEGGYGAVRSCASDQKIGPLFAPDTTTALRLLGALSTETVSIDVPVARASFLNALAEAGWSASFSTTRMYRNGSLGPASPQVFGITTLELG
jgi:hypothetical protein